jgi:hypothetical protein
VTSAQFPLDCQGKENIVANNVTDPVGSGGNAKKRKASNKSVKPKGKRSKVTEDNLMAVDTHAVQENNVPGENNATEKAATRSGRKSNLPSRFKDAGYVPQKRNMQKNA